MAKGGIRVIGYHGTSAERATKIMREGFKASVNPYDWIGTGVYFFEENLAYAKEWAGRLYKDKAAVIGAAIDLTGVLDLTENAALRSLKQTAQNLQKIFGEIRMPMPKNDGPKKRYFDKFLIDLYCEISAKSDIAFPVVRGLFEEGDPIHAHSHIRHLTHIQLAVRDQMAILGTGRVWP